jgi:hypothetical protein
MNQIITLAEGASELPFPTFVTGVIAMGIFILLGLVTWSYRDVANRHSHKSDNSAHH